MVMVNANDGKILGTVPLAGSSDGAVFNPSTMEAFSSSGQGDGVLTIVKEDSAEHVRGRNRTCRRLSGAKDADVRQQDRPYRADRRGVRDRAAARHASARRRPGRRPHDGARFVLDRRCGEVKAERKVREARRE